MALKKELEILVSDSMGGEEWLPVLVIDFVEEIAVSEGSYGNEVTLNLNSDSVHDIRITE